MKIGGVSLGRNTAWLFNRVFVLFIRDVIQFYLFERPFLCDVPYAFGIIALYINAYKTKKS